MKIISKTWVNDRPALLLDMSAVPGWGVDATRWVYVTASEYDQYLLGDTFGA